MSVDGMDCKIQKPSPFSPSGYSHKFKSSGLRYEIGLSLFEKKICWVNGPFPCGSHNDQKIFTSDLEQRLFCWEKVIADKGYHGVSILRNSRCNTFIKRARARHETINRRIKSFLCIGNTFHHKKEDHVFFFHAVAQLVQVSLETEQLLFEL